MRIQKIHIDSFGTIRNWHSPELEENMTLISGNNEAGKSTITEFVSGTMFPVRTVKYPLAKKTDSGTIEVKMDSGEGRTFVREQKKVIEVDGKRTPPEEFHMDSNTYRSVFAMDIEQLTNDKIFSSGEFKNKFLTVPGGENIPEISKKIDDSLNELMNKEKMTDTKVIGGLFKEIRTIDDKIGCIHSQDEKYDMLMDEKHRLVKEINELKTAQTIIDNNKVRNGIIKSQKENVENLKKMESERDELITVSDVPLDSEGEFKRLKSRIAELSVPDDETRVDTSALCGNDPKSVLRKEDSILNAWNTQREYLSLVRKRDEYDRKVTGAQGMINDCILETGWTEKSALNVKNGRYIAKKAEDVIRGRNPTAAPKSNKTVVTVVIIIGAIIIAAGAFTEKLLIPVGLALIILSFILPIVLRKMTPPVRDFSESDWKLWIINEGYPIDTTPEYACVLAEKFEKMSKYVEIRDENLSNINHLNDEISKYEQSIIPICKALNIESISYVDDVNRMHSILNAAVEISSESSTSGKRLENLADAEYALKKFLKRYGTEENFIDTYGKRVKLDALESKIKNFIETIEASSKLEIGKVKSLVENKGAMTDVAESISGDSDALNTRIGEINAEQRAILDGEEMSELMMEKTIANTKLNEAIRKWAVLMVADNIIADACTHFYTDLQPSVIKTANLYLGLMTNNRYQLDNDPRKDEIIIKDANTRKTSSQWSSGLGDQVYLSIKMALAKEMSSEKLPLILDDVLIRFDRIRKEGACRAIYEFAKDQQVIMFTCDGSLSNLFKLNGKMNDIVLSI